MTLVKETQINGIVNGRPAGYERLRSEVKYFPAQKPYDNSRPVKVIILGAGIGGTAAALLLSKKVRNITLSVYDQNSKIGGTWASNVYPGVRCDVPSHCYQLSFAPNTQWSEYYPKGDEIQQYYENTVKDYGLFDRFHLQHKVLHARWQERQKTWSIEIQNLVTGEIFIETADFFVSSQGRISQPKYPDIEGLNTFKGDVIHTANWKSGFHYKGKSLAVVGNGASAQQMIPNIIHDVAHIDHYVRTKTWVTATFSKNLYEAIAQQPGGPQYTEIDRTAFSNDPAAYLRHRRELESKFHHKPGADVLGSQENQFLRDRITEVMLKRVGGDEEFLQKILPDYAPGCKRLTPAPGYLEALIDNKLAFITDPITRVDETGIWTKSGTHQPVDALILATGFDHGFTTKFPVIGLGGVDLKGKWSADGEIGFPESYLGIMAPEIPNYFTVLQAQGNARGGTVPLQVELSATYIAKVIRKIQSESYAALHPKASAATEFNDIVAGFFDDKVVNDKCSSWFKQGPGDSRILIAWPGSYHHRAQILREPRWEDFEYVVAKGARRNRFEFFGDGWTRWEAEFHENEDKLGEKREEWDIVGYLKEEKDADPRAVHEAWYE
ncbi:FAD/NAD(P)-binding domain-containing protein [Ophiobolus disseminans]|uniref:FAD/NAD(P)-binding domain-containing protein n=1 Tax=Ophiobolus disseminans TaxID=1469910 RepID=A0A6A7AGF6_9PLEO|nr:FAD/NAD(P)-binding domain-containing protein [Ophiobolus disseminans]